MKIRSLLILSCMILFGMHATGQVMPAHGSMRGEGLTLYLNHNSLEGDPVTTRPATLDYKLVTLNGKTYAWTKLNPLDDGDYSINEADWASQLRYFSSEETGGAVENQLKQRSGLETWGVATASLPTILTNNISLYNCFVFNGDNYSETNRLSYNYNINNSTLGETVIPVLGTCSALNLTTTTADLSLQGNDNSGNFFYYIKGDDIEMVSLVDECTLTNLVEGATYNLTIVAVDFDGNESEAKVISFTTSKDEFNPAANLALNKSSYASSGSASSGNDGDTGTRWESASNDGEWWYVNLGAEYMLNKVKIMWEGAYTKVFDIQVALTLPEDPAGDEGWTTVFSQTNRPDGNFKPNYDDCLFTSPTPAKYVKIKCITRGTGYGNSFWEFEVYGTGYYDPNSGGSLSAVSVNTPLSLIYMDETPSVQFSYSAVDGTGNTIENLSVQWSVNPTTATIENGLFIPSVSGDYTITCTATKDDVEKSGTATITVRDPKRLADITLSTPKTLYGLGETFKGYTIVQKDQFDQIYNAEIKLKVNDVDEEFTTAVMGDYTLVAYNGNIESNPVNIMVVNPKINSSIESIVASVDGENGKDPISLIDGEWRTEDRPEANSEFPVDIAFTFTDKYLVEGIEIYWEGASARAYEIYAGENLIGGEPDHNFNGNYYYNLYLPDAVETDNVTLNLLKPYTQYGYNILGVSFYGGLKPSMSEAPIASLNEEQEENVLCWTVEPGLAIKEFEIYRNAAYDNGGTYVDKVPYTGETSYCYNVKDKMLLKSTNEVPYQVVLVDAVGDKIGSQLVAVPSTPTSILTPYTGKEVISIQYFTIDGRKAGGSTPGLYIVKKTYNDNSVKTEKVFVK